MKKYLLLGLLPVSVFAQAANISLVPQSTFASFNLSTQLQNASPDTYFTNDGFTSVVIKGGGTAVTATILNQAPSITQDGYGTVSLSNQTVSIPSASLVLIGPFPQNRWNTPIYGTAGISFSAVTGVSITAISAVQ